MASDMKSGTLDLNFGPATGKLCISFLLLLLKQDYHKFSGLNNTRFFFYPASLEVRIPAGLKSSVDIAVFHLEAEMENLFHCFFHLVEATPHSLAPSFICRASKSFKDSHLSVLLFLLPISIFKDPYDYSEPTWIIWDDTLS